MRSSTTIFIVLIASLISAGAFAQSPSASPAQVAEDAEKLQGLFEQIQEFGSSSYYRLNTSSYDLRTFPERAVESLEKFRKWRSVAEQSATFRQEFATRYNAGGYQLMHLDDIFGDELEGARGKWQRIQQAFNDDPAAIGTTNRDECMRLLDRDANARLINVRTLRLRIPIIRGIERSIEPCLEFTPETPRRITRMVEGIRERLGPITAEVEAEMQAALEARQWPAAFTRVSGGGGAQALAQAGLAFMRREAGWGGNEEREITVLHVQVRGDWFVAERNILGQPTKWGLPIWAAVRQPETPEGQADVFELSLVTRTAQKGTNWLGVWVGDYERYLLGRVPGQRGSRGRRGGRGMRR